MKIEESESCEINTISLGLLSFGNITSSTFFHLKRKQHNIELLHRYLPGRCGPLKMCRAYAKKRVGRICCGKLFNSKCQCRNSFAPEQQFKVVELLWINSNLSRLFQINPKSHPDVSASTLCPLLHHEQTAPGESASSLVPV